MMRFKVIFLVFMISQVCYGKIWKIGPTRTYKYCSQVASLVDNGDTIEIDYDVYINDTQVIWKKNNLYIKGVGGRPRLQAGSIIANDMTNGKGIFVINGSNTRVENIEFANAKVIDNNGAGIRQEGANLTVQHCKFINNEMGILCGAIVDCTIIVENSEFLNGGSNLNPGYQHNVYIGHIDTFVFRYNYTYDAIAEGHELKSRANNNFILYNTIANYTTEDSRNIDLPNGGTAIIMGNVIEQGPNSANTNLFGYGKEGLTNSSPHDIWIINNTFVNKKTKGNFIDLNNGTNKLYLKNNILAGAKSGGLITGTAAIIDTSNNIVTDFISDCGFVDPAVGNYHILSSSKAKDKGININEIVSTYQLKPDKMYKDTCEFEIRNVDDKIDIGAFEYYNSSSSNDMNDTKYLNLFPNPASNFIQFDQVIKGHDYRIFIYNINGNLVKYVHLVNKSVIDISDLPSGQYIIRLITSDSSSSRLILIN